MKLSADQYAALVKMARHFDRIEQIVEGTDVENEVVNDHMKTEEFMDYPGRKKNHEGLSAMRQSVFRENGSGRVAPPRLTVYINEDRFPG